MPDIAKFSLSDEPTFTTFKESLPSTVIDYDSVIPITLPIPLNDLSTYVATCHSNGCEEQFDVSSFNTDCIYQ